MRRFRRLRQTAEMRSFVREHEVSVKDLIYPVFVKEGEDIKEPVDSMPGVFNYSLDRLNEVIDQVTELGIPAILIFGIPEVKDEVGSEAYNPDGITQRAIRQIKERAPHLIVIGDVCMCEYTSHGHCGILSCVRCNPEAAKKIRIAGKTLQDAAEGRVAGVDTSDMIYDVDNDKTIPLIGKIAVSLAEAGADIVAPSDMMDGRVAEIRRQLDEAGLFNVPIMGYSAKFASAFYGPFRDAAGSAPSFGDRKSYQMDPANGREAMREIADDLEEGADLIIVKPAMVYMDIMKEARQKFDVPFIAYNVSGEYAMVKAAAANGWIDEKRIVMETMISVKRAGADRIITYHALDVAKWLREE